MRSMKVALKISISVFPFCFQAKSSPLVFLKGFKYRRILIYIGYIILDFQLPDMLL